MAFYQFNGAYRVTYPAYEITVSPGDVVNFGAVVPPGDGQWSANAGPATNAAAPIGQTVGPVVLAPADGQVLAWSAAAGRYVPITLQTATAPFTAFTTSGSYVVPQGVTLLEIAVSGGGAGGNGGGSALTSGGVGTQVGGSGGGAGGYTNQKVPVTAGTTLTVTVGAGGTGGAGAAANGQPGGLGTAGGTSSVSGTGIAVSALGGGTGSVSLGNSAAATSGGFPGNPLTANGITPGNDCPWALPGSGGLAQFNVGAGNLAPLQGSGASGGNGGGPASASAGGVGGAAGITGVQAGWTTGSSGSINGSAGGSAANNSSCGGGGGGGGATGTGGAGGAGGSGWVTIKPIS